MRSEAAVCAVWLATLLWVVLCVRARGVEEDWAPAKGPMEDGLGLGKVARREEDRARSGRVRWQTHRFRRTWAYPGS